MTKKLLIVNNRFFPSGGPERYLFNLLPELPAVGYDPVPFAMRSSRNLPSPFSSDFADHPLGDDFVLYGDRPLSMTEKLRLAARVVHDKTARAHLRRAIEKNDCDLVYGLQIAHYLYPETVLAAADTGRPVILRMSDFQIICPAYSMFRDGAPCDLCKSGLAHALAHRCMKGAALVTGARVLAMKIHRQMRVLEKVSAFVCPTDFMKQQLQEAGIAPEKIHTIATPLSRKAEALEPTPRSACGPVLFVGGLYEPKGAQIAVRAAMDSGFDLVIAGHADTPLAKKLIDQVKQAKADNVTFAGFVDRDALDTMYQNASAVVIPSLWYENSPNVALEAMAHARPVIASDLGSLPETVEHNKTGLLFEPGNAAALADAVKALNDDPQFADGLGTRGRAKVLAKHSMGAHLIALADLFGRVQ
jgi:glycosyltransferase involved in cell wall biosynthesis